MKLNLRKPIGLFSSSVGLLLLTGILSANAQESKIQKVPLQQLTQISYLNYAPLKEQLSANAQESKIQKVPLQQLTQILPPNYAPLKDSWIILLIEVSAYGLLCEYAKKLLYPHPNEQKTNFMRVNAEDVL